MLRLSQLEQVSIEFRFLLGFEFLAESLMLVHRQIERHECSCHRLVGLVAHFHYMLYRDWETNTLS